MPEKQAVTTTNAPTAVGPYSQANVVGDFVFTAGQLGVDPQTGQFVSDEVQAQTRRALENLRAVLEAAGTDLAHVVKTTVFLSDMANFKAMNEVYATFFEPPYPARSAVAVKELPLGGLVEIEAVAVKP
ncbi:MAG TPA: RidA family protein [Aggregatilineales bacterium]|nr:RidA family protein [Aggregatilineales bacterium]